MMKVKNVFKKGFALLLGSLFCAMPLAGCGADTASNEEMNQAVSAAVDSGSAGVVPTKKPTYYEVPNEFRFTAYSTPPKAGVGRGSYIDNADYRTLENWLNIRDCGFNYTNPIYYDQTNEDYIYTLEMAERSGLKVLLPSSDYSVDTASLAGIIKESTNKGWTYQDAWNKIMARENAIKARYDTFAQYRSFAGIFASDEPNSTQFPAIAAAQDWFEINYPNLEFFVNLLPQYANSAQLHGNMYGEPGYGDRTEPTSAANLYSYEDHVERYSEIVNPYIMAMDHYAIGQSGTVGCFYFNHLVMARNAQKLEEQYGWEVPYHVFLQTMRFGDRADISQKEYWTWQVNNSLVFGATGIYTFNYWPLMSDTDGPEGVAGDGGNAIGDGVVGRDGEKGDLYYWMQDNIGDLEVFEDTFMKYNWVNTAGIDKSGHLLMTLLSLSSYYNPNINNVTSVDSDVDVLIGEFELRENDSKKGYYITNAQAIRGGTPTSASVTVNFASASQVRVHDIENRRSPTQTLTGNQLSLTIAPGAAYFVEVL